MTLRVLRTVVVPTSTSHYYLFSVVRWVLPTSLLVFGKARYGVTPVPLVDGFGFFVATVLARSGVVFPILITVELMLLRSRSSPLGFADLFEEPHPLIRVSRRWCLDYCPMMSPLLPPFAIMKNVDHV